MKKNNKVNDLKNSNKKNKKIAIIILSLSLLLISGTTYSFFSSKSKKEDSSITENENTDPLTFDSEGVVNIEAKSEDFKDGKIITTATATLKNNGLTTKATGKYNVFFIIDNNDFEYLTSNGNPEIILKVIDPNGNEVKEINGLKRVEDGFDITNRTGTFLIRADYDIETTDTTTQEWKVEVILTNPDSSQNENAGKTLNGKIYITEKQESSYKMAEINSIELETSFDSIKATLNIKEGTNKIDKYYYAILEDEDNKEPNYIESTELVYVFNNLKQNTKYKVYSYIKDSQGMNSNVYKSTVTTNNYIYSQVTDISYSSNLNNIKIIVSSQKGTYEVAKYYFSKDNGLTWSKGQTSNTYTFDNLFDTTSYNIKIKVEDTNGVFSPEYTKTISTDTYINPSITKVTSEQTYNSITLTTLAIQGTNNISKYYYSNDDGLTWNEGINNIYQFTGLNENTNYKIKVKVEDTNGRASNIYSLESLTTMYKIPIVTATFSKTSNSITINSTALIGDGTITKYLYSKDGGSNWETVPSNLLSDSYTFDNLTPGAEYPLRVKVIDSNNRESTIYSSSVITYGIFTDYTENNSVTYDGTAKSIVVNVSPDPTNIYYSTDTELNEDNYDISGTTTNPTRTDSGETKVYWCAEKEGYITYCSNNSITINKLTFTNNTKDITTTYNGNSQSITPNLSPSPTSIYYSTTTLNESNYTSGTTTKPTRTNAGTTIVYWCAIKDSYTTYCGSNKITINKANPTFTVASTSVKMTSSETSKTVAYTYNGDGTVSCSPTSGTYASCSVNRTTKKITFTKKAGGSQTFTISASAGTNYNAASSKKITVTIESGTNFASYIKSLYTSQGSNGIYYHDSTLTNGAGDKSYRYSGADPNNYVCFGSTSTTCPTDNLYRIIGVFGNQIRLIKFDYATKELLGTNGEYVENVAPNNNYKSANKGTQTSLAKYFYNYKSDTTVNNGIGINEWKTSLLNKTNLNTNYLKNIGTTWANKIALTTWYVGGFSLRTAKLPKEVYNAEVGANRLNTTYSAKIGLIYASDYGFATSYENWKISISNYQTNKTLRENNWIYLGDGEWTISPDYSATDTRFVNYISGGGGFVTGNYAAKYGYAVRPVFNLNSSVVKTGGTGTKSSPYRIN